MGLSVSVVLNIVETIFQVMLESIGFWPMRRTAHLPKFNYLHLNYIFVQSFTS